MGSVYKIRRAKAEAEAARVFVQAMEAPEGEVSQWDHHRER